MGEDAFVKAVRKRNLAKYVPYPSHDYLVGKTSERFRRNHCLAIPHQNLGKHVERDR